MKKISLNKFKKAFLLSCIVCLIMVSNSFTSLKKKDCDPQALLSEGVSKLKNFTFVKEYPFSFKEKKKNKPIEYKKQLVTLNRGVKYKFLAISNKEYEGQAVVSIFNNEKQEILVATTYNQAMKKHYDEISFECKTTGNYCLSFCFNDGMEGCAVGIMAFLE
ncbi:MAG: hypothetical protein ACXVDC_15180 [Bacteroidia bacterium]